MKNSNWVNNLIQSEFFGSCENHRDVRKNEKNMYCIDCNISICKHCNASSDHCLHRWLQICKYVYRDVVRLQDIRKYLDCSKIQTYKINGEKAVHLNPRPSSKDSSKSSKSKSGVPCEACERHLKDLPNHFCSIACKISSDDNDKMIPSFPISEFGELSSKETDAPEETIIDKESFSHSFKESSHSLSASSEHMSSALKPKKKIHRRKGIPHRAPFF